MSGRVSAEDGAGDGLGDGVGEGRGEGDGEADRCDSATLAVKVRTAATIRALVMVLRMFPMPVNPS
jgi:hypothetical protein